MLPLAGETFPKNEDELRASVRRGFEAHGITAREILTVGSQYPQLEQLIVDLGGARMTRHHRPPRMETAIGNPCLEIAHFEMRGEPLYFENVPLDLKVEAERITLRMAGSPQAGSLLPEKAAKGTLTASISHESLESLVKTLAYDLAATKGIEVKSTRLVFTQEDSRRVAFRAELTAKVFIMTPTLALAGRLEIDDEFNARLSALHLDGDSMVTSLAGSYLRPLMQKLEGTVFPLAAFAPAGLKLRDIELTVAPSPRVHARFGETP